MPQENEIHYYIEDANIYLLWKLAQPDFCPHEAFYLREITPKWQNTRHLFQFLRIRLEMCGVTLKTLGFEDTMPEKNIYPPKTQSLKDLDADNRAGILEAYKALDSENGTMIDVEILSSVYAGFSSEVYFVPPAVTEKQSKSILAHIDEYIEHFLNRELFVYDRNYWLFEKQKEHLIEVIRRGNLLEKFGSNFVVSENINTKAKQSGSSEFLFIHTIYALQKIGYLKVLRLWHEMEMDSMTSWDGYSYHANVVVFPEFVQEINSSYQKDNPAVVFEKYDDKKTTIHFAGKTIEISKKGKENDAVALMRVLVKDLDKDKERYWYEDEVADDVGNDPDDIRGKNKYYHAARRINAAVRIETKIDDFIDATTKKYRINPKYLKS